MSVLFNENVIKAEAALDQSSCVSARGLSLSLSHSLDGLGVELQHRDLCGRGVSLRINWEEEAAWTTEIMRRVSSRREALPHPTSFIKSERIEIVSLSGTHGTAASVISKETIF